MNFLRYDPETGAVKEVGWNEISSIEAEIASGAHVLVHDGSVQLYGWRINLQTMQPEKLPDEVTPE